MAGTQSQTPSADREERDIHLLGAGGRFGQPTGVAGEVHAVPRTPHQVADRRGPGARAESVRVVAGGRRGDLQLRDGQRLARRQFTHVSPSAALAEEEPGTNRCDDRHPRIDHSQRGNIKVVVMQVRDEHHVRVAVSRVGRCRPDPA